MLVVVGCHRDIIQVQHFPYRVHMTKLVICRELVCHDNITNMVDVCVMQLNITVRRTDQVVLVDSADSVKTCTMTFSRYH